MFKAKLYLVTVILGMLALVAGACAQLTPTTTGTLKVYVTDAPPREEVTGIMVTAGEVQVHKAVAEQEREQEQQQSGSGNQTQGQQQAQQGEGEWISIEISDDDKTFDLLEIRGIEKYLGASEIEAAKYTQVRLVVETVQVEFENSDVWQDARVPSKELKIVHPFNVLGGETTALVLDFDADRMVTVTGAGDIIVKPVAKVTVKQEKSKGEQDEKKQEATLGDAIWVLQSYGEPGNLKAVLEGTEITATFESTKVVVRVLNGLAVKSTNYSVARIPPN